MSSRVGNERRSEMAYKVYVCGPGEVGPQCGYVSYDSGE